MSSNSMRLCGASLFPSDDSLVLATEVDLLLRCESHVFNACWLMMTEGYKKIQR